MRGGYVFQGVRTCFPGAFVIEYCVPIQYVLTSVYMFRGEPIIQGVRMCFPGAVDTEFGHRNSYVLPTEGPMQGDTGASGRVFPDATEYQFDLSVSKARTATLHQPVQISDRALALSEVVWSTGIVYGVARSDQPLNLGRNNLSRVSWGSLLSNIIALACAE